MLFYSPVLGYALRGYSVGLTRALLRWPFSGRIRTPATVHWIAEVSMKRLERLLLASRSVRVVALSFRRESMFRGTVVLRLDAVFCVFYVSPRVRTNPLLAAPFHHPVA